MTTKIERLELARSMSDEQFATLSKVLRGGKHGVFEHIEHYGKYAIAALLAYVSYDYFNCNEALLGWFTGISAGLMVLYKSITDIIASTIYSMDIVRNKKYDEAMEITDLANELRRKQIETRIENLEKLEDEQPKD